MTFTWRGDGEGAGIVVASGTILPETPEAFENFAADHARLNAGTVVHLSSDGGDLAAGLALGRTFRRLRLNTNIGEPATVSAGDAAMAAGRCSSACALAFLGGVSRGMTAGSSYGVHQLRLDCVERWRTTGRYPWLPVPGAKYCPAFDDAMSAFQSAQGAVAAYSVEMGADPLLFSEMAGVAASQLRFLSPEELEAFDVTAANRQQGDDASEP